GPNPSTTTQVSNAESVIPPSTSGPIANVNFVTGKVLDMPDYVTNIINAYSTTNSAVQLREIIGGSGIVEPNLLYNNTTLVYSFTGAAPSLDMANKAYVFESGKESYDTNLKKWTSGSSINVTNGLNYKGKCFIVAEGDIILGGSSITYDSTTDSAIIVYSRHGNVTVMPGNSNIRGLLYAPNGNVILQGNNISVEGSVVALNINSLPGGFAAYYNSNVAHSIPGTDIPQEALPNDLSTSIMNFVKRFYNPASTAVTTKFGVFTYDDRAYGYNTGSGESFDLIDVNSGLNSIQNIVNNLAVTKDAARIGKCNLGDALRMARFALSADSGKDIPKYIIVLSRNLPNYETVSKGTTTYYTSDYEIAGTSKSSIIAEPTTSAAIGYTTGWSPQLFGDKICSVFVNIHDIADPKYDNIDKTMDESISKVFSQNSCDTTDINGNAVSQGSVIGLTDIYHYQLKTASSTTITLDSVMQNMLCSRIYKNAQNSSSIINVSAIKMNIMLPDDYLNSDGTTTKVAAKASAEASWINISSDGKTITGSMPNMTKYSLVRKNGSRLEYSLVGPDGMFAKVDGLLLTFKLSNNGKISRQFNEVFQLQDNSNNYMELSFSYKRLASGLPEQALSTVKVPITTDVTNLTYSIDID
ncbi:MAG TPA: hypothetical protein VF941_04040, partial [Clostridia bacterium]